MGVHTPVEPVASIVRSWENDNTPTGAGTPAGANRTTQLDLTEERWAMPILPRPGQGAQTPPPNCPICTEPATLWGRSERSGITTANYLCDNDHGWLTKWVTP